MPVVPSIPPIIPVSDILDETRRHLLGMSRTELNKLQGSLTATDSALICQYDTKGITRGGFLGIEDEVVYVWAQDAASKSVTAMERGMQGTTPATHAAGSLIEVNPRFPLHAVRYALKEEIRSWGPQLYQVLMAEIATTASVRGYDLTTLGDFYQILDVRMSNQVSSGNVNPKSWPRVNNWSYVPTADTANFPSGHAVTIPFEYGAPQPTLSITFAAPFDVDTEFDDETDLIADVGLSPTMADIAPIGAAWRLLAMQEVKRTSTQTEGEPNDLQMVPPNYIGQAASRLKQMRDSRIADEVLRIKARVPSGGWG